MKHTIKTLFIVFGIGFLAIGFPAVSSAAPIGAEDDTTTTPTRTAQASNGDCPDNTAKQTAFKFNGKNTCVGFNDMLIELMKFMSALVGILVVGGIIVGGIVYSTGSGNPAKTQKGVMIIVNSVVGLILYLLMFAIVNFLVPGGVIRA